MLIERNSRKYTLIASPVRFLPPWCLLWDISSKRRMQEFRLVCMVLHLLTVGAAALLTPPRPGAPMHFWYDALFDRPHTDRWGKRWTADNPWKPLPGP